MTGSTRRVEILYFDSCPGWRGTVERLRHVLADAGLEDGVSIHLVPVDTEEQARRLRFLGSPSIRVDGFDIEQPSPDDTSYTLRCRLYEDAAGLHALPPMALIRRALGLESDGDPPAAQSHPTRRSQCP